MQSARIRDLSDSLDLEILSHYYMRKEVKDVSHFVGGTRAILARAKESSKSALIVCAVNFISERIKEMRPDIPIIIPRLDTLCPLSEKADLSLLEELRRRSPHSLILAGLKTAKDVKDHCDKILKVEEIPSSYVDHPKRDVLVLPTLEGPGGRVKESLRDLAPKCMVHAQVEYSEVMELIREHPRAQVLSNSLATDAVKGLSDFIGDTDDLFHYVESCGSQEYIVVSEWGLIESLSESFPGKKFYELQTEMFCPNMKLTNLKDILSALEAQGLSGHLVRASFDRDGDRRIYDLSR
jgi:quinolinate synthase